MHHRLAILIAAAVLLAIAACNGSDLPRSTDTVTLPPTGRDCLNRTIDGEQRSVCFVRDADTIRLDGDGLKAGSSVDIAGSSGDTLNLDVDADEGIQVELSGQIVSSTFTVRGVWSDGEALSLTVDYTD